MHVSPTARLLGFAGLLPQLTAVALIASGVDRIGGAWLALGYGGLILSFLGGIWWGFAMRRSDGQGALAVVAVVPSLVALALGIVAVVRVATDWSLVALGSAIMLTLLVDRRLAALREAPAGWMGLRVPLSLGLGVLTIFAGALGWR